MEGLENPTEYPPDDAFTQWGKILGGGCEICEPHPIRPDEMLCAMPAYAPGDDILAGGTCVCDNIGQGRFTFPSAAMRDASGGKYDHYFQGRV